MPLFIIERKNTARRDSLAVSTYLMTGFDNSVECALAWKNITGEDHPTAYKIFTLDEYIDSRSVHEIVNEPKVFRAHKSSDGNIHLSTLPEITSRLIAKKSLLVISISAPMTAFSGNKMIELKKINDKFISDVLFGREKIGSYIHIIDSAGPKLSEVIEKHYSMAAGNAGVVIIYNDSTVSNIQVIENELFGIRHESILITKHSMFSVIINNDELVLKYAEFNNLSI